MSKRTTRPIAAKIAFVLAVLLSAEFALPNYVSRLGKRFAEDTGLKKVAPAKRVVIPEDMVLSNEFAFRFVSVPNAQTERVAGVLGPDQNGAFVVVDQKATKVAGRDLQPLLDDLGAWYPDKANGGIKQLFEVEGTLFGLLGLARKRCVFAALVNLDSMTIADEFPCLDTSAGHTALHGLGGGYHLRDKVLMIAVGTGSHVAWSPAAAQAQNPDSPYGKILAYDVRSGSGTRQLANRRVVTSGHRNPQGMAQIGNHVLAVEHGPMGGDEINLVQQGANFGWPEISAGSQYNQGDLPSFSVPGSGVTNPLFTFVPSIAISDISPCPSLIAERYDTADCAIISALRDEAIHIVLGDFAAERVWSVERVPVGARVREVFLHEDTLYLVPDHADVTRTELLALPCRDTTNTCGRE